jgi:hypothetical protein
MGITVNRSGPLVSIPVTPATTSKTAVYTGDGTGQGSAIVLTVRATNTTGSGVTLDLAFYSKQDDVEAAIDSRTVSANSTDLIEIDIAIQFEDELRATVGTGGAIDLVITYIEKAGGTI